MIEKSEVSYFRKGKISSREEILQLGADVKVLKPKEVRQEIREEIERKGFMV